VSQISIPMRIVLVGAVLFLAAWFTVLKPSQPAITPEAPITAAPGAAARPTDPGAAATPASAAGRVEAKAKDAAAKAESNVGGAANAGVEDTTAPAPGAPSASAKTTQAPVTDLAPLAALSSASLAGLPRAVRGALRKREVIVLGVLNTDAKPWAPMAEDDRSVRDALRRVNRYGGEVVVRTTPLGRVAKYDGLIKALNVAQSPTVVVIDRDRRAVALPGYVDERTVDQAIADARRASTTRDIQDTFLRKVNANCAYYDMLAERAPYPTVGAPRASQAAMPRLATRRRAGIARITAPARWRGLKARYVRALDADVARSRRVLAAVKRKDQAAVDRAMQAGNALPAPVDRRLNAAGLTACATNRTR
jgi:hypothetical protein